MWERAPAQWAISPIAFHLLRHYRHNARDKKRNASWYWKRNVPMNRKQTTPFLPTGIPEMFASTNPRVQGERGREIHPRGHRVGNPTAAESRDEDGRQPHAQRSACTSSISQCNSSCQAVAYSEEKRRRNDPKAKIRKTVWTNLKKRKIWETARNERQQLLPTIPK